MYIERLEDFRIRKFVFDSPSRNYTYLFGIIDYLQLYNQEKKIEKGLNIFIYGKSAD